MSPEFEQVLNRAVPERKMFLEELGKLYPPEDVHGLNHVLEVEKRTIEVLGMACREAKARGEKIKINPLVLTLAALSHDVGYTAGERNSLDKFEHQSEGVKIIKRIIDKNFGLSQREKAGILILIWMHDNTAFTYPLKSRGGEPLLREKQIRQRGEVVAKLGFLTELRILREADSFFATGDVGLRRTIEFSSRKGLPFFSDAENPLRADMWETSIVGNLRLSARRAFEDAFTRKGKMMALVGWAVQELEIYRRCQQEEIRYVLDPILLENVKRFL